MFTANHHVVIVCDQCGRARESRASGSDTVARGAAVSEAKHVGWDVLRPDRRHLCRKCREIPIPLTAQ